MEIERQFLVERVERSGLEKSNDGSFARRVDGVSCGSTCGSNSPQGDRGGFLRDSLDNDRMDILGFCGEHGLNAYIYTPKDDPYHRDKWREPYPKKKLKELASLVEKARENRVKSSTGSPSVPVTIRP